MEKVNNQCVLATDFSQVDKDMKQWHVERDKKVSIYRAFSEYIECLEVSLLLETDFYKRKVIEKEIKKLKKQQQKFSVPSILGACKYDSSEKEEKIGKALKKSSFSLVKKLGKN